MNLLRARFWTVVFIFRAIPRLCRLVRRLVLWGGRGSEEIDEMLKTSLFNKEWEAIQSELRAYIDSKMRTMIERSKR